MRLLKNHDVPWWAVISDGIGASLVGVGLLLRFGSGILPMELPANFADKAITIIVVGILFMAPLIIVVIKRAASGSSTF